LLRIGFALTFLKLLQRSGAEDPVPDLHAAAGRDMEEIVVKEEEMIKTMIERRTVFISGWIVLERAADRAGLDWPCCSFPGVHPSPACLLALLLYKHLL
jgi:hypothetical protein